MQYLKVFSVAICLALVACGGGGGDSSDTQANPPPTATNAVAEGIWVGTNLTTMLFPSITLITSTGDVGIDLGNGIVFTGIHDVHNDQIVMVGGENVLPEALVFLGGTLNSKSTLNMEVTQGAYIMRRGDTLSYSYDSIYERGASLATVEGAWSGINTFMLGGSGSNGDWTFTIAADGTFTGDFLGLPITGSILLIDSSKNEYSVQLSIGGQLNGSYYGTYSGTATVIDTYSTNDTLMVFLERPLPYPIRGRLILLKK